MASSDETVLFESLLRDLPSEDSERESRFLQAARYLSEFAGKGDQPLSPALEEIALRLTRDALFALYQGFRVGSFSGVSGILTRLRRPPPIAQERLQQRLQNLLWLEVARKEMFHWFLAALRQELGGLLRQQLDSASPTLNPIHLFIRLRGKLALMAMEAFRMPANHENPDYEFGLGGLRLLFSTSGEIHLSEWKELQALLAMWVETLPNFPEWYIRDLMRVLRPVRLPPEQCERFASLLLYWRDMERYPQERLFASRRQYIQAVTRLARMQGYGKWFVSLVTVIASFLPRSSFSPKTLELWEVRRDQAYRHGTLTIALGVLATQEERFFPSLLQEIRSLLATGQKFEFKSALLEALPAFLHHPNWLDSLAGVFAEHGFREFGDLWKGDLDDLHYQLSAPALEKLLELVRHAPQARWAQQILEHTSSLSPDAEDWLCHRLTNESDAHVLETVLLLHQRLVSLNQPVSKLENALWQRIQALLEQEYSPVPAACIRWLLGLEDEALRRLLSFLAKCLTNISSFPSASLSTFLHQLAIEVNVANRLSPLKLAICWLLDPQDGLGSGLPLEGRLRLATDMLRHNRFDESVAAWLSRVIPQAKDVQSLREELFHKGGYPGLEVAYAYPRLADTLLESLDWSGEHMRRAGTVRRLALARALGRTSSPQNALPLLRSLFTFACDMHAASTLHTNPRAFPEFCWEARELAQSIAQSVARLKPVLPEAVYLMQDILLTRYTLPEEGFSFLSPAYVGQTLLPLLAGRPIASESVPVLLGVLNSVPPGEEKRQLLWQCALQWLSNVEKLNPEQQAIVWNTGYASPLILTRSLALLVLGRQRPLSERTWHTVLTLLHTPWRRLLQERSAEISRLSDRDAWSILGPGDVFLLAGVAVALTAEWSAEAGLLCAEQQDALRRAWSHASSDFNRSLEARRGVSWINAQGLALALCSAVGKSPEDDPDWLVRPADLASHLLVQV